MMLMNSMASHENPKIGRLFEKIYCNNKKVNATLIDIE